jgi:hypothetical protein
MGSERVWGWTPSYRGPRPPVEGNRLLSLGTVSHPYNG